MNPSRRVQPTCGSLCWRLRITTKRKNNQNMKKERLCKSHKVNLKKKKKKEGSWFGGVITPSPPSLPFPPLSPKLVTSFGFGFASPLPPPLLSLFFFFFFFYFLKTFPLFFLFLGGLSLGEKGADGGGRVTPWRRPFDQNMEFCLFLLSVFFFFLKILNFFFLNNNLKNDAHERAVPLKFSIFKFQN